MPSLLLLLALAVPCRAGYPAEVQGEARRIAFSLEIAAGEYAKAVAAPKLDPAEQAEAVGFLSQARLRFKSLADSSALDDFTRGPIESQLAALEADARAAKGDPGDFRSRAARAGLELAAAFGASARPVPARRPSAAAGEKVFAMHCAMCHGARGDGHGPAYPGLTTKPARFDDAAAMRRLPPAELFRIVSVGVEGTAMTGFDDRLSDGERWDAVNRLFAFTIPAGELTLGRRLLAARGAGVPHELLSEETRAQSSTEELEGRLARLWPSRSRPERAAMASALRLEEPGPASRAPALAAVKAQLSRVLERRAASDAAGAYNAALDAYLLFEPLEKQARVEAPAAAASLEAGFGSLRDAVKAGASREDLESRVAALGTELDGLAGPAAPAGPGAIFAQSFLIIAREGFEVILILGAIAALLARAGRGALLGVFYAGAWAGVAASFLTAWALEALLDVSPLQREALEGLIMLAAAFTLVYVSYWMLATMGMRNWNQWLRGRLGKALEQGGGWGLASVAFLAVYREGFETVLFYKALWSFAPGQGSSVLSGFLAGCAALAALFLVFRRSGLRLPMRPFFLATGAMLYALAFTFLGQGVAEMQAAGWLTATATPWTLSVPWAGIHPTWETAAPQLLLAAAALFAFTRTTHAGSRPPPLI